MEKIHQQMKKPVPQELQKQNLQNQKNCKLVWDGGSTLYDSFELKSFQRELDSAIHSRTLSMPHLSDRRVLAPPPPPPPPPAEAMSTKSKPSKISRSLNKFLKSMFRSSKQNSSSWFRAQDKVHQDHEYYLVYDKSGALTTIPEVSEIDFGGFSPEINSLVRKSASARFTPASMGISCP